MYRLANIGVFILSCLIFAVGLVVYSIIFLVTREKKATPQPKRLLVCWDAMPKLPATSEDVAYFVPNGGHYQSYCEPLGKVIKSETIVYMN